MRRYGVRLLVAISTFTIGIAISWTLIPHLPTFLLDQLLTTNNSEVSPVRLVVDPSEDANEIYRLLIQQKFTFNGVELIVLHSETRGCPMFEDESVRASWGRSQAFHEF